MSENLSQNYSENFAYNNPDSHSTLLMTIQNCEATCEHMTTFLKCRKDVQSRVIQLQLLRDCADICTLTAKYIARNSGFSKCIANLCAYICEVCGTECLRFPDPESQHCAQVCLHCARECRVFAMMP
ncbi:four-helix bundle copper-binding protein [Anaerophilus nitritogenes]|uniref:four-helix bundle copper-binding protein n=1 Tax=Anaerophilus nitritogenes TaxID=2498136 RepID=UPI001930F5E4|nr:four-helix bundle copper-binding protein [Anaerophilus nitritogenes]